MKSASRTVLGVRTLTQTVLNRQMAHTKLCVPFGLARKGLERTLEVCCRMHTYSMHSRLCVSERAATN